VKYSWERGRGRQEAALILIDFFILKEEKKMNF